MGKVSLTEASRALCEASEVMAGLVSRFGPPRLGPKPAVGERFEVLSREIAYQQLAGKAAGAIWGRVREQAPEWAAGCGAGVGGGAASGCRAVGGQDPGNARLGRPLRGGLA